MSTWSSCFSHHLSSLTWHLVHPLERIHFILKSCSSHWSAWLKNTKLLLIKNLWICKSLVSLRITQMGWSHYLLWHHKIVLLRSVHSFWTLNTSHTILSRLSTHSTNISNPRITSTILFNLSRSVTIFVWNFRAISLQSYHSSTDSHDCRLNISISLSVKILTSIDALSIRNLTSL